jgi:hypothetical protein
MAKALSDVLETLRAQKSELRAQRVHDMIDAVR